MCSLTWMVFCFFFFFQAEDGIRDYKVTGVQTCALPISTVMLILAVTVVLNLYLYIHVPKGFFPQQDTGLMMGQIQADQSISFQAMREKLRYFVDVVRHDPAVATVGGFTGGGQRNPAHMF